MACIGILSAGAMGSSVGRSWSDGGARVVTTAAGRSARTAERAAQAGLELLPDLAAVVAQADVVASIAPPDQAEPIAAAIAAAAARTGARPLVADLNAVAPDTVERIAASLAAEDLRLIDGSISGPPVRPGGPTILYLSGPDANVLAELPADGLRAQVVGNVPGAASAVKMCTASVLKGFVGLLTQAMITARVHGVQQWVASDLGERFPAQLDVLPRELTAAARKAWRYVPEMREIAATQGAAGARPELFDAMAAVWEMVSQTPLADADATPPSSGVLDDVLDRLVPRTN